MRKIPWGLAFLIAWALFLTASVTFYLQYLQPSKLGETVSYGIPEELNLNVEFQFVSFQFLPNPAIIVQGIRIEDTVRNIEVNVDRVEAELSWKTLFAGKPLLHAITLIRPSLHLSLPDLAFNNAQRVARRINRQADRFINHVENADGFASSVHTSNEIENRKENQEDMIYSVRMRTLRDDTPETEKIERSTIENKNNKDTIETHTVLTNPNNNRHQVATDITNDSLPDKSVLNSNNVPGVADIPGTHTPEEAQDFFASLSPEEQEEEVRSLIKRTLQVKLPYIVSGTYVHIRDGEFELLLTRNMSVKEDALRIQGIQLDLRPPDLRNGYIDLRLDHTSLSAARAPDIDITQTALLLRGWDFKANTIEMDLDIQTLFQMGSLQKFREKPIKEAYRYFPMPEPAKFSIETKLRYDKESHNLDILGLLRARVFLPMNKRNTPVFIDLPFVSNASIDNKEKNALRLPLETPENKNYRNAFLKDNDLLPEHAVSLPAVHIDSINIENAYVRIGRDRATITGEVLGLFPLNPLFQGKATLHHFSLPRWIGSARKMSGGLVNALDNIRGEIEVIANKRGLFAPHFKGIISNIEVEGMGSCGNFKAPDIALVAYPSEATRKKGTIDLNPLFPEINGIAVTKQEYPNPAVPAREPDDTSESMFVDYHIDIRVPDVKAWKLNAKNVTALIAPDINESPTVQVRVGQLYNGSASAYAVLDKGKNYIKATVSNVSLERPITNIAGFAAAKGTLFGEAQIHLSGSSMGEILSSMTISAKGNIDNGSFHTDKSLLQKFSKVLYRFNLKSIPFYIPNTKLPTYFQMKGDYDIALADPSLQASVYSNAIIDFSIKNGLPLRMKPQTANIKYKMTGDSKFEAITVDGTGLLSYDFSGKNYFEVKDFSGLLHDEKVSGLFRMDINEPLDWSGDLLFQSLNLDSYLFGEEDEKTGSEKKSSAEKNTPESLTYLPVDFLADNNFAFKISANEATILDTTLEDFTSTFTLKRKELTIEKTTANVKGGGKAQVFLEAKITPNTSAKRGHILSQFKFQLEKANMLSITTMREHDTLVAGNGLIQLTGNGIFQTTSDFLTKLNGKYNINIRDGYIETTTVTPPQEETRNSQSSRFTSSRQNSSRNTGSSKTYFNNIAASGDIKNGILHNDNFFMSSKSMIVKGGGTLNLVTEEINASAKADLGISNVPITITGTLDNPVTNIKLINAVASTVGRVGTGIFNLLGGILRAPIDMLTHEKVIQTPPTTAPPMPELPPLLLDQTPITH